MRVGWFAIAVTLGSGPERLLPRSNLLHGELRQLWASTGTLATCYQISGSQFSMCGSSCPNGYHSVQEYQSGSCATCGSSSGNLITCQQN